MYCTTTPVPVTLSEGSMRATDGRSTLRTAHGRRLRMAAALLALLPATLPAATDLGEVYQRALRNDPQLREAEAIRLADLEAKPEALAALLPQLNASGSYVKDQA